MINVQREVINIVNFGQMNVPFNPLNAKLNPICHLLTLLRAHPILHVSRIRVKAQKSSKSTHRSISYHKNAGSFRGRGGRRINCLPRIISHTFQKCIIYSAKNHYDIIYQNQYLPD